MLEYNGNDMKMIMYKIQVHVKPLGWLFEKTSRDAPNQQIDFQLIPNHYGKHWKFTLLTSDEAYDYRQSSWTTYSTEKSQ